MSTLNDFGAELDEISRTDLSNYGNELQPPIFGFREVNEEKNQLVRALRVPLRELELTEGKIPMVKWEASLQTFREHLREVWTLMKEAENIRELSVKGQLSDDRFPKLAARSKAIAPEIEKSFGELNVLARLVKLESLALGESSNTRVEANEILERLKMSEMESHKMVVTLQSKMADLARVESVRSYATLSARHKTREILWGVGLAAATGSLLIAVLGIVHFGADSMPVTVPDSDVVERFLPFFVLARQTMFIGLFALFLKIALTKYNAERHLRILYDHRQAAMETLEVFEASIPEGSDLTSLRLEAAKMLLSDPATSYGSNEKGTEVTFSPRFSAIEKAGAS